MTPIATIFLAFMAVVGIATGLVVVRYPQAYGFALPPYLWVLAAMALFELAVAYARGVSPGALLTMPQRVGGFALGGGLALLIPYIATKLA